MYIYIYTHTHMYMHTYIHTYIYIYIYMYMHIGCRFRVWGEYGFSYVRIISEFKSVIPYQPPVRKVFGRTSGVWRDWAIC